MSEQTSHNEQTKLLECLNNETITQSEYVDLIQLGVNVDSMPKLKVVNRTLCYHPALLDEDEKLISSVNQQVFPRSNMYMQFDGDYDENMVHNKTDDIQQKNVPDSQLKRRDIKVSNKDHHSKRYQSLTPNQDKLKKIQRKLTLDNINSNKQNYQGLNSSFKLRKDNPILEMDNNQQNKLPEIRKKLDGDFENSDTNRNGIFSKNKNIIKHSKTVSSRDQNSSNRNKLKIDDCLIQINQSKYKLCEPFKSSTPISPFLKKSNVIVSNCKLQKSIIEQTGINKNKYAVETIRFRDKEEDLEKCCVSLQYHMGDKNLESPIPPKKLFNKLIHNSININNLQKNQSRPIKLNNKIDIQNSKNVKNIKSKLFVQY